MKLPSFGNISCYLECNGRFKTPNVGLNLTSQLYYWNPWFYKIIRQDNWTHKTRLHMIRDMGEEVGQFSEAWNIPLTLRLHLCVNYFWWTITCAIQKQELASRKRLVRLLSHWFPCTITLFSAVFLEGDLGNCPTPPPSLTFRRGRHKIILVLNNHAASFS